MHPPAEVPAFAPVHDSECLRVSNCHSGQQDICSHRAVESRQRHGLRIKPSRKQCGVMKLSICLSPACPVTVLTVAWENLVHEQARWVCVTCEHTHVFFCFLFFSPPHSRSAEPQQILRALWGEAYVFCDFFSNYITLPTVNTLFYSGMVAFLTSKYVNTTKMYPSFCNGDTWRNSIYIYCHAKLFKWQDWELRVHLIGTITRILACFGSKCLIVLLMLPPFSPLHYCIYCIFRQHGRNSFKGYTQRFLYSF